MTTETRTGPVDELEIGKLYQFCERDPAVYSILRRLMSEGTVSEPANMLEEPAIDWPREVTAILERVPGAVRVCEGGGPENLAMSLAVTVAKLARQA